MRNNGDQSVSLEGRGVRVACSARSADHLRVDGNRKKYDEPNSIAGACARYQNNAYEFLWDARWATSGAPRSST
jgi:hypothetical protein